MTEETTRESDDVRATESLTDPERLREDPDVPFTDETAVRDDRDHCAIGIEGRAVVGVADEESVLLSIHDEEGVAIPFVGAVESGDDWAAVARETVEISTDQPIELDAVEVVREIDHVVDGEDEPHTTTFNVVFRASPTGGRVEEPSLASNDHWDAEWFDEIPDSVPDFGQARDDLRLFLD